MPFFQELNILGFQCPPVTSVTNFTRMPRQMISFQKIYGLYGLEHHIVDTDGERKGCHKCAQTDRHTDTHSEYSVNLDSRKLIRRPIGIEFAGSSQKGEGEFTEEQEKIKMNQTRLKIRPKMRY